MRQTGRASGVHCSNHNPDRSDQSCEPKATSQRLAKIKSTRMSTTVKSTDERVNRVRAALEKVRDADGRHWCPCHGEERPALFVDENRGSFLISCAAPCVSITDYCKE